MGKSKATPKNDAHTIAKFLFKNVSNRGLHFLNKVIEHLLNEFMVIHRKSPPYHLQANGQAKSTKKILKAILTKIVSGSK